MITKLGLLVVALIFEALTLYGIWRKYEGTDVFGAALLFYGLVALYFLADAGLVIWMLNAAWWWFLILVAGGLVIFGIYLLRFFSDAANYR